LFSSRKIQDRFLDGLTNQPTKIISQFENETSEYQSLEFATVLNTTQNNGVKTDDLVIVMNENDNRYDILASYVFDNFNKSGYYVPVYGKWSKEIMDASKSFKGGMRITNIKKLLPKFKYSLVIPSDDGWVTSKYIQLIDNGVIPFFHPSYDTNYHSEIPAFLRVKSPEDFAFKINELNDNQSLYDDILIRCQSLIKDEHRDGTNISNILLENTPLTREQNDIDNVEHEALVDW
jgi:hypothetical protein